MICPDDDAIMDLYSNWDLYDFDNGHSRVRSIEVYICPWCFDPYYRKSAWEMFL